MPAHAPLPSPDVPAVVAGHGRAAVLTGDGEILTLPTEEAATLLRAAGAALVVHAPATLRRLGLRELPCFDLLHLFAFALPSRYEGTAGAAIEALALETPIVATALVGTEGLLVDDDNARLVPVGDAAALAGALLEVAHDPAAAARRAQSGRRTFEHRFTLDRSADAMVALYRSVAAMPARPRVPPGGLGRGVGNGHTLTHLG